jgi:L-rhamnose mutarotase
MRIDVKRRTYLKTLLAAGAAQAASQAVHRKVWPTIENTLSTKNYSVILFDES